MILLYGLKPYHAQSNFKDFRSFQQVYSANTGNLLFVFALHEILQLSGNTRRWGDQTSDLSSQSDTLLMPLANHIGKHVDMSQMLKSLDRSSTIPIVCTGLGAQLSLEGRGVDEIPEGTWEMIAYLGSRAPTEAANITVRGPTTLDILKSRGLDRHAVVLGCQSNFLSADTQLGLSIRRRIESLLQDRPSNLRIAVAAGNPHEPRWRKLEQSLAQMASSHQGFYVVQNPADFLRVTTGFSSDVDPERLERYADYVLGTKSISEFLTWMQRYSITFASVPDWQRVYRTCDFVVGTRIHGCMTAIQAGVPAICLFIDSRTKELCEQMQIPCADARDHLNGISVETCIEILSAWQFDFYDERRAQLAHTFSQFLKSNRIHKTAHIDRIASP